MGCCFSAATRFAFSCSRSFTSLGCRATLLSSSAATSRHATPCRLYTQTYIKTRRQLKERTAPKGGTSLGPGNPRAVTDTYPTKSSPPHKRYPTPQPSALAHHVAEHLHGRINTVRRRCEGDYDPGGPSWRRCRSSLSVRPTTRPSREVCIVQTDAPVNNETGAYEPDGGVKSNPKNKFAVDPQPVTLTP